MARKGRLDRALVDIGIAPSRSRAQALILAGKVLVDGQPAKGAAEQVSKDQSLVLKEPDIPYVSRGGVKLEGALEVFELSPAGKVCLDLGASTGGFTDCLLKRGASKVYAVDVGYGQLAWSLRNDDRVVVLERTNARHLTTVQVPEPVELITGDLSFISLTKVLPAVVSLALPRATYLLLVKPQFEAGRSRVGKGGVVRDDSVRKDAVDRVSEVAQGLGLLENGRADSTIAGPKGNREIFLWLAPPEEQQSHLR